MHSQVVVVETISEPAMVLMHLLRLQGSTLTDGQRQHVLDAFDKRTDADAAGTPLWLTIVAQVYNVYVYVHMYIHYVCKQADDCGAGGVGVDIV